jgi:hypothetical protein
MSVVAKTPEGQSPVPTTQGFQDEREIWEVTHVREEDLETTEGEGVDFLPELLDLVGWSQVNDEETEKTLS